MRHLIPASIAVAATALALALAAPAAADEEEFLRVLQIRFAGLTAEQLLQAGYQACDIIRTGVPSSEATIAVSTDLGISISAADDIVRSASANFGC